MEESSSLPSKWGLLDQDTEDSSMQVGVEGWGKQCGSQRDVQDSLGWLQPENSDAGHVHKAGRVVNPASHYYTY